MYARPSEDLFYGSPEGIDHKTCGGTNCFFEIKHFTRKGKLIRTVI